MSSSASRHTVRPQSSPRRSTAARPTDEHLLDAACRVFARSGYVNTTMSAVAAEADSTKPTLYAHFEDKETLYLRALAREAGRCRRWLVDAYARGADLAPAAQVDADMMAFFDYAAVHPDGFAMLFLAGPTEGAAAMERALRDQVTGEVAQRVRDFLSRTASPLADSDFVVHQTAAMLVGVAVSAADEAVRTGRDLAAAGRFASAFAVAAVVGLVGALDALPARSSSTSAV